MDYRRTYQLLIDKRRNNPLPKEEYGENHHIIPRSEGGSYEPNNLVKLTAREHYVAHLLLARIYNDEKMWGALMMMSTCKGRKRQYRISSRLYQMARISFAEHHSRVMKKIANSEWFKTLMSNAHKGKPPHNKGKPCSEEQKEKLRQANLGKKQSEETKRKRNAKLKGHPSYTSGMKWWNNGVEDRMCRECPEGWVAGRCLKITDETRSKMRKSHIGHSPSNKGKPMSEEQKEKLRRANLGKKQSEETIQKRVQKLRGQKRKPHTEETKMKLSASVKAWWKSKKKKEVD